MIGRLFLMRLKCLFRDKENVFWSALFPIFLSFVFSLVFANIGKEEQFATIDIAIVNANEQSEIVNSATNLKYDSDTPLFDIVKVDEKEAQDLLKKGKIKGYIIDGEKPSLYLGGSGIEETIIKSFVDSYIQTMKKIEVVAGIAPDKIGSLIESAMDSTEYINDTNKTGKSPDWSLIYYYALLSLACLYGCNFGITEIGDLQADKSAKGARISVAPVHKLKLLICNVFAAITVQVVCIMVAIGFMAFVLNIDFGTRVGYVVLTCVMGSICGVSFGAMLRSVIHKNEKTVSAIANAVVLFLSFLSGLMNPEVKYLISDNIPFFSKINPSNLITDSLYYLYYFDSMDRFWFNVMCMGAVTVLFMAITYFAR
ncbi:ABC transporter permease [Anaerosporobacter faecicola]|uniref:ABC transporter permease n=1 Tax=Anaerosporobacter faecicola TaxID=2718714 RepID=UPI00143A0EED|nr:ABC transporter permease [Anaerosporobacter faecicola]